MSRKKAARKKRVVHNNKPTLAPVENLDKTGHDSNCGFCGKGKNEVALMCASPVTKNTICSTCAMTIVTQTMSHMVSVSAAFSDVVNRRPEWFEQDPGTGAVSLIDPDQRLDDAVNSENEH